MAGVRLRDRLIWRIPRGWDEHQFLVYVWLTLDRLDELEQDTRDLQHAERMVAAAYEEETR
jgi:hypothetical protein